MPISTSVCLCHQCTLNDPNGRALHPKTVKKHIKIARELIKDLEGGSIPSEITLARLYQCIENTLTQNSRSSTNDEENHDSIFQLENGTVSNLTSVLL